MEHTTPPLTTVQQCVANALAADNLMRRNETSGSYFLLFKAIMNYRHLSVRHAILPASGS
jgi:hypothetical protein